MFSLFIFGLFVCLPAYGQVRPPNFSPDRLPDTAFTCEDKVTGGYYADVEAQCQLFHVCVQVSDYEFQDFHFLCPNDTVFDQQHLVCTNWFEVDCHAQIEFFTNDFGVRSEHSAREDEDIPAARRQSSNFHGFRNTGRGQLDVGRKSNLRRQQTLQTNEFEEDLGSPLSGGGTPIPLGFTTTIRPPGKPSSSNGFLSGRNLVLPPSANDNEFPEPTEAPSAPRFSAFAQDGRRPKVKSNLKAKFRNSGQKKFNIQSDPKQFQSFRKNRFRVSKQQQQHVEDPVTEAYSEPVTEPFYGPDVRPDGREPRVKSDLLAEIQNKPETTTPEPFIEAFFGSPSSPKPFIFRGSPTPSPFGGDLFGSASTVQSFFVPTPKTPNFGISQTPVILGSGFSESTEPSLTSDDNVDASFNDIDDEPAEATDSPVVHATGSRFRSRPNPARFNRKRGQQKQHRQQQQQNQGSRFDAPVNEAVEEVEETNVRDEVKEDTRVKLNGRHPVKNRVQADAESSNSLDSEECNNPFRCARKRFNSGNRRPRVKSNIRAKKRNFWRNSNDNTNSSPVVRNFGAGANRKLRRGRKQRVQVNNNDIKASEADKDMEEDNLIEDSATTVEPFVPTVNPETVPQETSISPPAEEEADIFEDLFEQNNDLIVASSTISSVVFKGSPTPAPFGFFSSPGPSFDKSSGVFVASPRPSFTNIGNDIDLGPKKFFSPNGNVFVTSTQSNKIVIGSSDVSTQRPNPLDRNFPSFPIRGKSNSLAFPFRPKPSFGTSKLPGVTSQEPAEETKSTASQESETSAVTTAATTTTTTEESKPSRFNQFNRNTNRRFNSLFNRNSAQPTTTAAPTTTTTETTTTTQQQEVTTKRKFPFSFRQNKGILGRNPFRQQQQQPQPQPETAAPEEVSVTQPTAEVTSESSVLSVESELLEDSEINNEILDEEEEIIKPVSKPRTKGQRNFRRFPGVKKAQRPPPNANIRVEFKKAPVDDEQNTRKFFVKPDGRKPRVKSNIRARLANKGKAVFDPESDPSTFRHSTKVDSFEFNGDAELEGVDNTEKRAINPSELNLIRKLSKDHDEMESDGKFLIKENMDVEAASSPALPIYQPQPLTLNSRPVSNSAGTLLEQIVVQNGEAASPDSVEIQSAEASSNQYSESSTGAPNLSAFRALLSQTKSEFPFQLLNPRDVAQV